ncbi:MAG: VOC family protein [Chloroflexi bacterium]|nr:VOC family protein [Chloroflexota bacterium]
MKLIRMDHLDIVVSDLKKSLEFYRKFGLSPEGTIDKGETVFLYNQDPSSPVRFELHQAKPGQKTGIDHVSFGVEDVQGAYMEGKYLGVPWKFEPKQNMQSGRIITNTFDPDGVHLQICKMTLRGEYNDWK